MRRSTIVLSLALIGSNAWWVYKAFDAVVTATYQEVTYRETREALSQTLALLPVVARPNATKQEIVTAATLPFSGAEPFDKDGHLWVGRLGLSFTPDGHFSKAVLDGQQQ